jgi:hypothetical protein
MACTRRHDWVLAPLGSTEGPDQGPKRTGQCQARGPDGSPGPGPALMPVPGPGPRPRPQQVPRPGRGPVTVAAVAAQLGPRAAAIARIGWCRLGRGWSRTPLSLRPPGGSCQCPRPLSAARASALELLSCTVPSTRLTPPEAACSARITGARGQCSHCGSNRHGHSRRLSS